MRSTNLLQFAFRAMLGSAGLVLSVHMMVLLLSAAPASEEPRTRPMSHQTAGEKFGEAPRAESRTSAAPTPASRRSIKPAETSDEVKPGPTQATANQTRTHEKPKDRRRNAADHSRVRALLGNASPKSSASPQTKRSLTGRALRSRASQQGRNILDRQPSGPALFFETATDTTDHARSGSRTDDETTAIAHPLPTPRERRIAFRTVDPTKGRTSRGEQVSSAPPGLEARLLHLQREVQRLAQAQLDRRSTDLERTAQLLTQMQQSNRLQEIEQQLQNLQRNTPSGDPLIPSSPHQPRVAPERPRDEGTRRGGDEGTVQGPPHPPKPVDVAQAPKPIDRPVVKARPTGKDSDRFSLQIQDADITEVLKMLGELSGRNILIGKGVEGNVTVNLKKVTIEEALTGILRSLGYAFERDGRFIYVMTQADAEARKKLNRKVVTKIYRPHFISVKDLQDLITPLLTPEPVGKVATTNPAEVGIAVDGQSAGGNQLSQRDALLVQDYAEVIEEIDGIVAEMDVPPEQVVIEAMILSVALTDEMQFGVNFALLGDNNKNLVVSGNGQTLNGTSGFPGTGANSLVPPAGQFLADLAGLKYGFLQGDITAFLEALETLSDTNVIASPQLRVLNKQKAELIIGQRLAYRTRTFQDNQTIENVEFLDVGTKLILRPFVSPDGRIRMEIHPERSDGVIDDQGLPQASTTEVTTNIMARDGQTVIIGGLIDEQINEEQSRVPVLGAIPVVGNAFRNKSEEITRNELIVLITPRIVREPEDAIEGESVLIENQRRAENFKNKLAPINRRNLARMEFERALYYFEGGDLSKARRHVERSLTHSKNNLEALRLRDRIEAEVRERNRRWFKWPFNSTEWRDGQPSSENEREATFSAEDLPPSDGRVQR